MSSIDEIKTIEFLNARKSDFALLHCNSTYPVPFEDIQLNFIDELKNMHSLVGYSGHERGINISLVTKQKELVLLKDTLHLIGKWKVQIILLVLSMISLNN